MDYKRAARVAELLREVISEIITTQLKDPAVGRVTITRVKLSDDLKNARVYFSMLGNEQQRRSTIEGLKRATGFVRAATARKISLRHAPDLQFFYDDTLDYVENIENLLRKIHENEPPSSRYD
ncbi:MAG: 30S ribosome-binding factor RbfA [candidate division KSB1 bacterium]|nr:30S ribosome-binding factor RbfA [candidate division KSB1 bacterium]MDZ7303492.1 30S ribosome-binding factor RbfA [candidate division KSB1 bacterium]MDZ7312706.1 30S ribosome-binding factor RbfA [candidate division KSB1 bacterium]